MSLPTLNIESHPTAIIDPGAKIGSGTRVWHWTHICAGAEIGEKCSFGQNVYVGNKVKIGSNVKVQNNVSIYDNVILEDDVFCGPSMVFTNVINPRSQVNRKNEYLNTTVKQGATIGANATIVCGVTLGRFSFIGAGAVVTKSVPDFALMTGVPAVHVGWMSRQGEKIELPLHGQGKFVCPKTGDVYILENSNLVIIEGAGPR